MEENDHESTHASAIFISGYAEYVILEPRIEQGNECAFAFSTEHLYSCISKEYENWVRYPLKIVLPSPVASGNLLQNSGFDLSSPSLNS